MGLGPPEIELYLQLKLLGALEGIAEVMELGSQDFWLRAPAAYSSMVPFTVHLEHGFFNYISA
jgi:hypothetical protein